MWVVVVRKVFRRRLDESYSLEEVEYIRVYSLGILYGRGYFFRLLLGMGFECGMVF